MRRNVWLLALILIAVLLGVNNTIYYFTTKSSLESNLRHELETVAKQIAISIETSRNGSEKYQDQIGRELRAASIAAQYALNPDIEKVTNAQLVELKSKLDLYDLTLLKRTKDNIVLYRSSDNKQLNYPTSSWDPWYKAFNQLFDQKKVTVKWGQSLTNFWTGPFEFSTVQTKVINKWGYYYDGTTNYILDPYISYDDRQRDYDNVTGVNHMISETLSQNDTVLEIGVLNPETFDSGPRVTINENGEEVTHMTQNPILNGTNAFKHENDSRNVQLANETNKYVWLNTTINGKHVLKLYIPVNINKVASMLDGNGDAIDRYVLTLVADYQTIQDKLDKQFVNIGIIVVIVTALSFIIVYWTATGFRKSQDKLVRKAQETYVEEINQLFQSIRAQRHDFLNHVQTIHSLAEVNKIDELKAYTAELTGEIRQMNDIINIGNPAIAALIRAKISQAELLRVQLETSISDMNKMELGVKSLDMTRILGNLIDNAFDEALNYSEEERFVRIFIGQKPGYLEFAISNTCLHAETLAAKPLFESGYTSKDGTHSGLGLSIVKSIVDQYKGLVRIAINEPGMITFIVKIPD
ncbi:sensor histidine kinase [Paenibacillus solisilvae]|uniref:Sensor histidine kinase n=1 Tax=Paenibacillus solisilvae TaxID=2486751 RepID=A0ABW0W5R1_9BACL